MMMMMMIGLVETLLRFYFQAFSWNDDDDHDDDDEQ